MKTFNLKLSQFFRLNLISLRLYSFYKLNKYFIILLLISIISSILVRINIVTEEIWNKHHFLIHILVFLAILYSMYLIFNILHRSIQSVKIISSFKHWISLDTKNIKSIISLYYIQNLFFILLSSWILYNIFSKLNVFIEESYLYIISIGIISSVLFLYKYPLNSFYLDHKMKNYPMWVYLLLIFFFIFYLFILPFCIFKLINNDTFIQIKEQFINKSIQYTKPHYMNTTNSGTDTTPIKKFKLKGSFNLEIPESYEDISMEDSGNIKIIPNQIDTVHLQHKVLVTKQIDNVNLTNQPMASSSQNLLSSNQLILSNSESFNTEILHNSVLEYHLFILFFSYIEFFINICIDFLIKFNILNSINCMEDHTYNPKYNESNLTRNIMSKNKVIIHNEGNINLLAENNIEIGSKTVNIETLNLLNKPEISAYPTRLALTQQDHSVLEKQVINTSLNTSDIMKNSILEYQLMIFIVYYIELFINKSIDSLIQFNILNTIECMDNSENTQNFSINNHPNRNIKIRFNEINTFINFSIPDNQNIIIEGNNWNTSINITQSIGTENVYNHCNINSMIIQENINI